MKHTRHVTRRDFLKTGGVLVVGVSLFGCGRSNTPVPTRAPSTAGPWQPDVFVSIDAEGTVRIGGSRPEHLVHERFAQMVRAAAREENTTRVEDLHRTQIDFLVAS